MKEHIVLSAHVCGVVDLEQAAVHLPVKESQVQSEFSHAVGVTAEYWQRLIHVVPDVWHMDAAWHPARLVIVVHFCAQLLSSGFHWQSL